MSDNPLTAGSAVLAAAAVLALASCSTSSGDVRPAAAPEPSALRYAPFTATYEIVSQGRVEQQLPDGQLMANDFAMRYYLTAAITDSDSGFAARLVIDSVPVLTGSALGLASSEAERAGGVTFTSPMTAEGELTAFRSSDSTSALAQQLATRLKDFFLRIPASGASPGMAWSDSTRAETTSAGIGLSVTSVNRYQALGWRDVGGWRALHVRTVSEYRVSGSGTQQGQEIAVDGAGIRRIEEFVAPDGRYVAMTAVDTSRLSATLPAMGLVIPITQTRADTLRLAR